MSLPGPEREATAAAPRHSDPLRVAAILNRLAGYIRQSDAQAEDYLHESRSELGALPRQELRQLAASLADFDYDAAALVLCRIAGQLGVEMIDNPKGGT